MGYPVPIHRPCDTELAPGVEAVASWRQARAERAQREHEREQAVALLRDEEQRRRDAEYDARLDRIVEHVDAGSDPFARLVVACGYACVWRHGHATVQHTDLLSRLFPDAPIEDRPWSTPAVCSWFADQARERGLSPPPAPPQRKRHEGFRGGGWRVPGPPFDVVINDANGRIGDLWINASGRFWSISWEARSRSVDRPKGRCRLGHQHDATASHLAHLGHLLGLVDPALLLPVSGRAAPTPAERSLDGVTPTPG